MTIVEQSDEWVGNEEIGEDEEGTLVIIDTAGGIDFAEIPHTEED